MLNLEDELRQVVDALEARGVPYAIAGGIAVSIFTTPRATEDIDVLIDMVDLDRALPVLGALGFERAGPPMAVAQGRLRIQRLTKVAGPDLLPLDLLLAGSPQLEEVLRARQQLDWGGKRLWIVSIDGLRTLKRLRGSPQDLAGRPTLKRPVGDVLSAVSALRRLCLALPHAPTPAELRQLERFDRLRLGAASPTDDDIDALRSGLRACWRRGATTTFRDMAARIPAELVERDRWLQSLVVAAQALQD